MARKFVLAEIGGGSMKVEAAIGSTVHGLPVIKKVAVSNGL